MAFLVALSRWSLETNRLSLDDLAPWIRDLRCRQDELQKAKLPVETEQGARAARHLDARMIKAYAEYLRRLLEKTRIPETRASVRSFIKRIQIGEESVKESYIVPVPSGGGDAESVRVLPMVTPGGAEGSRTPDLPDTIGTLSRLTWTVEAPAPCNGGPSRT